LVVGKTRMLWWLPLRVLAVFIYNFTPRNLREFEITDTELKLMAAAAMIGLSSNPKNGYNTPAATGTPSEL